MPRPAGLIVARVARAVAGLLGGAVLWGGAVLSAGAVLLGGAVLAEGCAPEAVTVPAENGWRVTVTAPCHPYTPIAIRYGPLSLPETTGGTGRAEAVLPVLPDIAAARIEGPDIDLIVSLPPGLPPSGFLWLAPQSRQTGALPMAGFAAEAEAMRPEMRIYPAGRTPAHLDLPVTPRTCGAVLSFGLMRDGWETVQTVRLSMPACDAATGALRLPLPG